MKIALVVPGGVDRSGEVRVIPALLALIRRLAAAHDVHVFALAQEPGPGAWMLEGAHVLRSAHGVENLVSQHGDDRIPSSGCGICNGDLRPRGPEANA